MPMMLAAPLTPAAIVAAKVAAAAVVATAQALLLLPLVWVLGLGSPPAWALVALPAAVLLTALAVAAIGMAIAARLQSTENFAGVMNFVLFPMFFLSGSLYPVSLLPDWLQVFVKVNPLTYGVDLIRHILLAAAPPPHVVGAEVGIRADTTVNGLWREERSCLDLLRAGTAATVSLQPDPPAQPRSGVKCADELCSRRYPRSPVPEHRPPPAPDRRLGGAADCAGVTGCCFPRARPMGGSIAAAFQSSRPYEAALDHLRRSEPAIAYVRKSLKPE